MFNLNQYNMSKNININSIKLNASNIINIRQKLDKDIMNGFRTIRTYNVISKKAIKAGLNTTKDLKSLYNSITQMQEKRIKIKAMLFYLNMGITTFNFEEFKKTNNYSIFAAGEAKEAIAQLKMIPTLNPSEKSKKGLKEMSRQETFTSAKIAALIKDLQIKAMKFDENLETFNNNTSITITDNIDDFKMYLTA